MSPRLIAFIGGRRVARHAVAGRMFWRTGFALPGILAAMLLFVPVMHGQTAKQPEGTTLHGTVLDRTGSPVDNAQVVLQGESLHVSKETSTNASGKFTFSGVATGRFALTASSAGLRSAPVTVVVSASGEQPQFKLVLGTSGAKQSAAAQKNAGQAMQFADNPNFKIAAVTDWMAAGGHGSDVALRTSEAITRQAVELKPGNTGPAAKLALPGEKGQMKESEGALRAAVEKDPKGFAPNNRLGLFYLQARRYQDAIHYLQVAYQANPTSGRSEYDLARALEMAGDFSQAQEHVRRLLARRQSADLHRSDLHRMEGELDEKLGDPLSAVREFQQAASEDPSEDNYFSWGSELLFHRAVWPAKEVFDEGVKLYPNSARLLTARGAALFAGALYDQAALDLCRASDLNPENEKPYLFMGKIEIVTPDPLPCVVAKLARFQRLQPANALANYYYAMALQKQQGHARDPQITARVKAMLHKAVTLDPKCAEAYLELGDLSASQHQAKQAMGYYLKAVQANPELKEAHYRLAVSYERAGEKAKAREQFQLHDAIAKKQAAETQRERLTVKQFLVVLPHETEKQQVR